MKSYLNRHSSAVMVTMIAITLFSIFHWGWWSLLVGLVCLSFVGWVEEAPADVALADVPEGPVRDAAYRNMLRAKVRSAEMWKQPIAEWSSLYQRAINCGDLDMASSIVSMWEHTPLNEHSRNAMAAGMREVDRRLGDQELVITRREEDIAHDTVQTLLGIAPGMEHAVDDEPTVNLWTTTPEHQGQGRA